MCSVPTAGGIVRREIDEMRDQNRKICQCGVCYDQTEGESKAVTENPMRYAREEGDIRSETKREKGMMVECKGVLVSTLVAFRWKRWEIDLPVQPRPV